MAEYRVQVVERDVGQATWEPGILWYPEGSMRPMQPSTDLWWVDSGGCLAADGLRTNEETHGFVVNLRDKQRPQFTVDRNKLRSWNKNWVLEQIRSALPTLGSFAGLSLSWLWGMTEKNPTIAQEIFDFLLSDSAELSVEGGAGTAARIRLDRAGSLPIDREMFTGGFRRWLIYDQWIKGWRRAVWRGIVPPQFDWPTEPEADDIAGLPVVQPLDARVLGGIYEDGGAESPNRLGRPTGDTVLRLAAHETQPVADCLQRLRKYAIVGLDLRAARSLPPLEQPFAEEDLPIAPALAALSRPDDTAVTWRWAVLARVSAEEALTLGEVVRRAAPLAPPGWRMPTIPAGELTGLTFTQADLKILSMYHNGQPPWLEEPAQPAHVIRASEVAGRSASEVLAFFDRIASLGFAVAARTRYPPDLTEIERDALRYTTSFGLALSPLQIFVIACRNKITIGEATAGLARLARLGSLTTPDMSHVRNAVPTEDEIAFVYEELHVNTWTLLNDRTLVTEWQAFCRLTGKLEPHLQAHATDRVDSYRTLLELLRPATTLAPAQILMLAYQFECPVAEVPGLLTTAFGPGSAPAVDEYPPDAPQRLDQWWIANALFGLTWRRFLRRTGEGWEITACGLLDTSIITWQPLGRVLVLLRRFVSSVAFESFVVVGVAGSSAAESAEV